MADVPQTEMVNVAALVAEGPGAVVVQGDARCLPLPDESVDLIVTSPPYYALRSYRDGDEAVDGQVGGEQTPQEYLENLWAATVEMIRVLKPTGSIWVNLGDKYGRGHRRTAPPRSGWIASERKDATYRDVMEPGGQDRCSLDEGSPDKCLLGLPWRYANGCVDRLGLILRRDLIWDKPSGLPESVTDRCRSSHEYWFHFTKEPKYFAAMDEIRELHQDARTSPRRITGQFGGGNVENHPTDPTGMAARLRRQPGDVEPRTESTLGKLPGSVWVISSEPLKVPAELGVAHFAAFPSEFPRRFIAGWSPGGVCTVCGEGRRPVIEKTVVDPQPSRRMPGEGRDPFSRHGEPSSSLRGQHSAVITDYACACPEALASTMPAVVLDPFGGTGTVAMMAKAMGRTGISIDLSSDYCRLAEWRIHESGHATKTLARAAGKRKATAKDAERIQAELDAALEALDLEHAARQIMEKEVALLRRSGSTFGVTLESKGIVASVIPSKTNGLLIAAAAQLYIKPTDVVMDVTFGRGNWWTDYTHPGPFITHDLKLDGVDFRHLPEPDNTVDVVMFDPPYISPGGRKTSTIGEFNDRYGLVDVPRTPAETQTLIAAGMTEAVRVLAPGGRLMVKCGDYISSGKLVLGHHHVVSHGLTSGLEQVDEMVHASGTGPQPTVNLDGSPRRQVHSRRAHSFLVVFKKP